MYSLSFSLNFKEFTSLNSLLLHHNYTLCMFEKAVISDSDNDISEILINDTLFHCIMITMNMQYYLHILVKYFKEENI